MCPHAVGLIVSAYMCEGGAEVSPAHIIEELGAVTPLHRCYVGAFRTGGGGTCPADLIALKVRWSITRNNNHVPPTCQQSMIHTLRTVLREAQVGRSSLITSSPSSTPLCVESNYQQSLLDIWRSTVAQTRQAMMQDLAHIRHIRNQLSASSDEQPELKRRRLAAAAVSDGFTLELNQIEKKKK